jgi:hypothetical protein
MINNVINQNFIYNVYSAKKNLGGQNNIRHITTAHVVSGDTIVEISANQKSKLAQQP